MLTRRTVIKGSAWAVPVIAAAVAVPLASASTTAGPRRSRIAFTNTTATVGRDANTIYVNTRIKVLDGPDSIDQLTLTVVVSTGGNIPDQVVTHVWPAIAGWGVTELLELEFPGMPKDATLGVAFHAEATDCAPIDESRTVTPGRWWL